MIKLNLPEANLQIKATTNGHRIYDRIRQKFVSLTPEEWVRQNFVEYLISCKDIPQSLIANEIGITLNSTRRRCDTVIYDLTAMPLIIVEYKSPSVEISQSTFDQIVRYNMVLHARYLIVSNGLQHYCCRINYETKSYTFLKELPPYSEL